MFRTKIVAVAVLAIALAGCGGGQGPSQQFGKEDVDSIRQMVADFTTAYNAKDVEKIGGMFSGNAIIMPPNRSTLRGADMVKAYYEGRLKEEGATDLAFDDVAVTGEGTIAYVTGTYRLNLRPADAPEQRYRGKVVWILRKLGGQWRFEVQMMSSDLPPAAPPADEKPPAPKK